MAQRAQEAAGEREVQGGIKELERIAERRRRKREEEAKAMAGQQRSKRATPQGKPAKSKALTTKAPVQIPDTVQMQEEIDPSEWTSTADYMRLRLAQLRRELKSSGDS